MRERDGSEPFIGCSWVRCGLLKPEDLFVHFCFAIVFLLGLGFCVAVWSDTMREYSSPVGFARTNAFPLGFDEASDFWVMRLPGSLDRSFGVLDTRMYM